MENEERLWKRGGLSMQQGAEARTTKRETRRQKQRSKLRGRSRTSSNQKGPGQKTEKGKVLQAKKKGKNGSSGTPGGGQAGARRKATTQGGEGKSLTPKQSR